jgi:hypothetical protein
MVIPKELDDRARLWAAKLKTTRSKLTAIALCEYIDKLDKGDNQVITRTQQRLRESRQRMSDAAKSREAKKRGIESSE